MRHKLARRTQPRLGFVFYDFPDTTNTESCEAFRGDAEKALETLAALMRE